jgi:hypothetical protein
MGLSSPGSRGQILILSSWVEMGNLGCINNEDGYFHKVVSGSVSDCVTRYSQYKTVHIRLQGFFFHLLDCLLKWISISTSTPGLHYLRP